MHKRTTAAAHSSKPSAVGGIIIVDNSYKYNYNNYYNSMLQRARTHTRYARVCVCNVNVLRA